MTTVRYIEHQVHMITAEVKGDFGTMPLLQAPPLCVYAYYYSLEISLTSLEDGRRIITAEHSNDMSCIYLERIIQGNNQKYRTYSR